MNSFATPSVLQERTVLPVKNRGGRRWYYWLCVLALAASDVAMFSLAEILFRMRSSVPALMMMTGNLRQATEPVDVLFLLAIIFVLTRYIFGDYGRRQLFWNSARTTSISLLLLGTIDLSLLLLGSQELTPLRAVTATWAFLLVGIPVARHGTRFLLAKAGIWQIPTAVFTDSARSVAVVNTLKNTLSLGYDLQWILPASHDQQLPDELLFMQPIYADSASVLADSLALAGCGQAVLITDEPQNGKNTELIQRLIEAGIRVAFTPPLHKLPFVGLDTHHFFGTGILMFQVPNNLRPRPNRFFKRTLDIGASLSLLVLCSPFFAVICGLIFAHDRHSPLFAQTRVGRDGQPFPCLKFRSMSVDAEQKLKDWQDSHPDLYAEFLKTRKLREDPRITPIGKWLRQTSLDELPQLVNVLLGHMSLVGPRPVPAQELRECYGHAANMYVQVRPGITGLWQVSGRSETSYEERIVFDEWYITNWSFWTDVVILIRTVWVILARKGAF